MSDWKRLVSFVLVEPTEPANIGAAARAMKNMGFKNLSVVNPPFDPEAEADRLAHNAMDVLKSATIYESFEEAIAGAALVVGSSRRTGKRRGKFVGPEEAVQKVMETAARGGRVALLFGRERTGLLSHEVEECAYIINIPTDSPQPSLNIAQAVMVVAYELEKLRVKSAGGGDGDDALATHDETAKVVQKSRDILTRVGYPEDGEHVTARKVPVIIKHFLGRASLTKGELHTLGNILTRVLRMLGK